ncbi:MAG: NAD(P)H-dependent oxidoreductase subunit E [Gemmatimonadaceae bacterium]|nr:NAD(P)H-dependent oxidoreductase subunit E [Gloeobacterales cyanobacterium ES-bin-141]
MGELQTLEGEVLAFVPGKKGRLDRFKLSVADGECLVKFPKEWAGALNASLHAGERVQVRGKLKFDEDSGEPYLKAITVLHLKQPVVAARQIAPTEPAQAEPARVLPPLSTRVLVCTSSDCCKRGAKALCRTLAETIEQYGLQDRVRVEKTGCMKRCKQGPNLVIMPQKARFTRVGPEQATELLLRQLLPKLE